jgi:hypothetical protein
MTSKLCRRTDCQNPKVPGQGQQLCTGHKATAESERDERRAAQREAHRRLGCQFPDCRQPKLRGQGQRYCEKHSADKWAREIARAGNRVRTRRSGLSDEQYQAMIVRQGGLCALCGGPPGRRQLAVDHDHACCPDRDSCGKCLRELLCDRCNPLLGYAHDDIAVLEAAIAYLKKHARRTS